MTLTAGCSHNQANGASGGLQTQAQLQQSLQKNGAAMDAYAKSHPKEGP